MKSLNPPKRRVFLIDDSEYTGILIRRILAPTEFYFSGQATSMKQALRRFPESRSNLILIDSTLPDATLTETIDAIKAINSDVKIVVMGPLMHLPMIQEVLGNGADSFLFKPIEPRTLMSVLRSFYKATPSKLSQSKKIALLYTGFFRELNNYLLPEVGVNFNEIIVDAAKKVNLEDYVHIKYSPLEFIPKPYVKGNKMLERLHEFYIEVFKGLKRRIGENETKGLFIDAYQSFYYEHQHLPMPSNLFPPIKRFFLTFEEPINIKEKRRHSLSVTNLREQIMQQQGPTVSESSLRLYLALSSFDPVLGPKILISCPTPTGSDRKKIMIEIPENMDLMGVELEEPFLTFNKRWGVYNIIFSVNSMNARGGSKDYMLSLAVFPTNDIILSRLSRLYSVIKAVMQEVKTMLQNMEEKGIEEILNTELLQFLTEFQLEIENYFKKSLSEEEKK